MSEGDRIFLLGNNAQMPNVKGWSMRDVMYFLSFEIRFENFWYRLCNEPKY